METRYQDAAKEPTYQQVQPPYQQPSVSLFQPTRGIEQSSTPRSLFSTCCTKPRAQIGGLHRGLDDTIRPRLCLQ